jgi:serine protease inhibitor ecotin
VCHAWTWELKIATKLLNNITKENNKIVRKLGKELLRNCNQVIFIGDVERGGWEGWWWFTKHGV